MLLQNALTMETADNEATKNKLAVAEHDLVALKQEQQTVNFQNTDLL